MATNIALPVYKRNLISTKINITRVFGDTVNSIFFVEFQFSPVSLV